MSLQIFAVAGIGEVVEGDDIASLIVNSLDHALEAGDVVVVTSKIVSKAAGLATTLDRELLLESQTDRIVAQRGPTTIVRTHHGLTLASAGIDASNIARGQVIPLPVDPDQDAAKIRERLRKLSHVDVAVIVTDTAGRAWRIGQTDIAIGVAGITPCLSFAGVDDAYGNTLAVTSPAIADEIAGAADLVAEKLGGNPAVIVRGVPAAWLLTESGPGAAALIREEAGDLFGLGSRDAVIAAFSGQRSPRGFPQFDETSIDDLIEAALDGFDQGVADLRVLPGNAVEVFSPRSGRGPAEWLAIGALAERVRVLAKAMHVQVAVITD